MSEFFDDEIDDSDGDDNTISNYESMLKKGEATKPEVRKRLEDLLEERRLRAELGDFLD